MKSPEPAQTEPIGWRHVRRIFVFNLVLFAVVLLGIFSLMAIGSGYTASDFKEDMPAGLGLIAIVSCSMALYVANLYRQSWNRRAKSLGG